MTKRLRRSAIQSTTSVLLVAMLCLQFIIIALPHEFHGETSKPEKKCCKHDPVFRQSTSHSLLLKNAELHDANCRICSLGILITCITAYTSCVSRQLGITQSQILRPNLHVCREQMFLRQFLRSPPAEIII